jgi:hypothetical protein
LNIISVLRQARILAVPHHQLQLASSCVPYTRPPKTPNHYMIILKIGTAIYAETLDNSQH